jgi:hypothetical protein
MHKSRYIIQTQHPDRAHNETGMQQSHCLAFTMAAFSINFHMLA